MRLLDVRDWREPFTYEWPGPWDHKDEVGYLIPNGSIRLSFFDVDYTDEVALSVNQMPQGFAPLTGNESWAVDSFFDVFTEVGLSEVRLENTYNPPEFYKWGVAIDDWQPLERLSFDGHNEKYWVGNHQP